MFSSLIQASDWKNLDGVYAITSENHLNPSENEKQDSHYRIQLKGDSAKELYNAIKANPIIDDCTGGLAKTMGEMQCIYYEKTDTYESHFSIHIRKQSIHYGVAC